MITRIVCLAVLMLGVSSIDARADESNRCGEWLERFHVVPGSSWGDFPPQLQGDWGRHDCDHSVCQYFQDRYGVIPYQSWGSLPPNYQAIWDSGIDCNHHVRNPGGAPAPPPQGFAPPGGHDSDAHRCGEWLERFHVVPGSSWGNFPPPLQGEWGQRDCDHSVCQYFQDKFGVIPYQTYGSLPPEYQAIWASGIDCNHHVRNPGGAPPPATPVLAPPPPSYSPAPPVAGVGGWMCLPGIGAPIIVRHGDVACAAMNGRDCLWGQCPANNPTAFPWTPPSNLQPLFCGRDHLSKYGVDGYSDPSHWCAKSCAATGECGAQWKCFPGIKAPVRFSAGNIECAATNGRDCLWDACSGENAKKEVWQPSTPLQPLACGADHQSKYGVDGYSDPAHWCAQACAAKRGCGNIWKCVPGIKSPVRVAGGDVQCAAKDGRNCLWDACPGNNDKAFAWQAPPDLAPLACGADHQAKYGVNGYSDPTHWCRKACDAFGCGQ